jgi:hypothetical protein
LILITGFVIMVMVCLARQQFEHGRQEGMWQVLQELEEAGVITIQQNAGQS